MNMGDINILERINLSSLDMSFSSKPLLVGGLAMEYYGLRKCGDDIDFIISDEDYQLLAAKYPGHRVDYWGNLGIIYDQYELLRSLSRLDYDFYSAGALEFEKFKVISCERLFFMCAAAVRSEPDVKKRVDDFGLALGYFYNRYRNKEYLANAELHASSYLSAPDGTIRGGKY